MLPLFTRLLSAEMDACTIDWKVFVQCGCRHHGSSDGPQLLQKPPTTFMDHTAASVLLSFWTLTASGCDHATYSVYWEHNLMPTLSWESAIYLLNKKILNVLEITKGYLRVVLYLIHKTDSLGMIIQTRGKYAQSLNNLTSVHS